MSSFKILTPEEVALLSTRDQIEYIDEFSKFQKAELRAKMKTEEMGFSEEELDNIWSKLGLSENLRLYKVKGEPHAILYVRDPSSGQWFAYCKNIELTDKEFIKLFHSFFAEYQTQLCQSMSRRFKPGTPNSVDDSAKQLYLWGFKHGRIAKFETEVPVRPVILKGTRNNTGVPIPAFNEIEYEDMGNNITTLSLGPYLGNFLNRTDDHDLMCALIYAHIIGKRGSQVITLYGAGGDGKTSFIEFVNRVLGNSYATYDKGRFGLYSMFNKAIIKLEDSRIRYLFQEGNIKMITGDDGVSIEAKGRTPFQGHLYGLVMYSTNEPIIIKGEYAERRRLCYCKVAPLAEQSESISTGEDLIQAMMEYKNEFLTYCRLNYDKLKNKNGVILTPMSHVLKHAAELLERPQGRDKILAALFDETAGRKPILTKVEKGQASLSEVINLLPPNLTKDNAFSSSNIRYSLELLRGVEVVGDTIYGWELNPFRLTNRKTRYDQ